MGSLAGGCTSFVTTQANQRNQYRRDFLTHNSLNAKPFILEFMNEAARLLVESLDGQMEKASGLVTIYSLHNRMRLNSSEVDGPKKHNGHP